MRPGVEAVPRPARKVGGGGGSRSRVRSTVFRSFYERVQDFDLALGLLLTGSRWARYGGSPEAGPHLPRSGNPGLRRLAPSSRRGERRRPGSSPGGLLPHRLGGEGETAIVVGVCDACAVSPAPSARYSRTQMPRRSQTPPLRWSRQPPTLVRARMHKYTPPTGSLPSIGCPETGPNPITPELVRGRQSRPELSSSPPAAPRH